MNNDEAKFLLNAYRPKGSDAADPAMQPPLEQAKRDPSLAAWFAREQAHGAAVAEKLDEITPPPGLREAILAGARAGQAAEKQNEVRPRWRQPVWLAVAAVFAVMVGVLGWRFRPVDAANFQDFAMNYVARGFVLEKRSAEVGVLKNWLAEKGSPLPQALPAEFAHLRALGCRTIDYRGREVSLMCFERGGKEFHVFVTMRDSADESDAGSRTTPRFHTRGALVAASWSEAKHRYVVVSDADMPALRQVL